MPPKDWTGPCDLKSRLVDKWKKGKFLTAFLAGECGPVIEPIKTPSAKDRSGYIPDFRKWKDSLVADALDNYEMEMEEVTDRVVGKVIYPRRAVFPSLDAVVRYIGKTRDFALFRELSARIVQFDERLLEWILKKPHRVLDNRDKWDGILSFVGWMRENTHPGIYLREVPARGVHTKFVEKENAEVIKSILDVLLPQEAINREKTDIVARYGFRPVIPVQSYVPFRMLDSATPLIKGLPRQFFAMPACDLASLELDIDTVFIVENHVTYETFPEFPRAICINGQGMKAAGPDILGAIGWLSGKRLFYAGDLDQSGFSILSHVRGLFPHVRSILMDEETLMSNRALWGNDVIDRSASFENLNAEEEKVRKFLCSDGNNIRLEQERIPHVQIVNVMDAIRRAK